jgi:NDP-4-keto-2,6-dideoxyhexose 3-C-methyltransferase
LVHLKEGEAVLDIGCNDGTLLASYKTQGIFRIGFDPAENLAAFSRKVANKVVIGFFESEAFDQDPDLKSQAPKIVTSIAMFYDLENPNRFVADIKKIMDPQGLWIVQLSYLAHMLKQRDFGNICHEHLEYYSSKPELIRSSASGWNGLRTTYLISSVSRQAAGKLCLSMGLRQRETQCYSTLA